MLRVGVELNQIRFAALPEFCRDIKRARHANLVLTGGRDLGGTAENICATGSDVTGVKFVHFIGLRECVPSVPAPRRIV
jgi:hypothetical protein